jgi:MerR family transcriptional regulator/heat shock protein HspR
MEDTCGLYVMRVASVLSGMHPQTLRKYERAGLLAPSRSNAVRMYSDEDIARLRTIKRLVDVAGLNLAGVALALNVRSAVLEMKGELAAAAIGGKPRQRLDRILDTILEMLHVEESEDNIESNFNGRR